MIFSTERLIFRFLTQDDFESLYRMYSDPEMREFFPEGVSNKEETQKELDWFLNGDPDDRRLGLWAAIQKSDGSFVGRGGLLAWEIDGVREIEIAYMVDKSFWRQGFGAEMASGLVRHGFVSTEAQRLIALTDHQHHASIKTAEAAGLTFWKDIVMDDVASAVYKIDRPSN